jgi:ribosomal protein L11 methyltransferase
MPEPISQNVIDYKTDYTAPHKNLYIYYFKGHLPSDATESADCFLGNWEEDDFSFLFFSEPSDIFINNYIVTLPEIKLLDQYKMTYEDWHGDKITAFRVNRFIITPPWEKENKIIKFSDDLEIILDPGLVFGTGAHPTTNDCLEALVTLWYDGEIKSILDLGTGTGLLAIAAAKLGCNRAVAVDFNYLAAKTALHNVNLNGLGKNILVVHGRAEELMDKASDLMISNIHYDVMKDLINTEAFLEFRYFILSGLLRSEARNIADQLKRLPVKILKTWDQDGVWHTFLGTTINL